MLLMFQKPAVGENCETRNQTFSMRLRFLTIRGLRDGLASRPGPTHAAHGEQTRGDPESALRWICKSTRAIARELDQQKHPVSHTSNNVTECNQDIPRT
jgi:hypothetical protein